MDPNDNLEQQLEIARRIEHNGVDVTRMESNRNDLVDLAELVMAMHEWLSKGGFLPEPWAKR